MPECRMCHTKMVEGSEMQGVAPPGYFGETSAEYGATQENNRSREEMVEIYKCPACGYTEPR
jgi:hypothetical protein